MQFTNSLPILTQSIQLMLSIISLFLEYQIAVNMDTKMKIFD